MKYTQIPEDTFKNLVLNAGILVESFDPEEGLFDGIMGATTGGITFSTNPSYEDYGSDIDNCPNNMMELKKLTGYDPTMSGTFLTVTALIAKALIGSADVDPANDTHVIPRTELLTKDFKDVWWIGDYSDVNTGEDAGYMAIHVMNALNTAGFQIKSTKDAKGQLAFEYHGHYSMKEQTKPPFELYVKAGNEE